MKQVFMYIAKMKNLGSKLIKLPTSIPKSSVSFLEDVFSSIRTSICSISLGIHMEVRIDEKTSSKKETEDLGIEVGNFISFDPRTDVISVLGSKLIKLPTSIPKSSVSFLEDVFSSIRTYLNIMRLKENIVRLKQTLAKRTQGQYVYMKQVFMSLS
jgi:hypothetical protein